MGYATWYLLRNFFPRLLKELPPLPFPSYVLMYLPSPEKKQEERR